MKLPGIGEKTATRLAFYTMDMPDQDVDDFAKSLVKVKKHSSMSDLWQYYRKRCL